MTVLYNSLALGLLARTLGAPNLHAQTPPAGAAKPAAKAVESGAAQSAVLPKTQHLQE
jgi:hypothetical protein